MSFALTIEQVRNQTKTVTRRQGWADLKPGDVVQPVEKCMGLRRGEKQVTIGDLVRVLSNTPEPIEDIPEEDLIKEGFPDLTTEEFIAMYCQANRVNRKEACNRIEFEYLVPLERYRPDDFRS